MHRILNHFIIEKTEKYDQLIKNYAENVRPEKNKNVCLMFDLWGFTDDSFLVQSVNSSKMHLTGKNPMSSKNMHLKLLSYKHSHYFYQLFNFLMLLKKTAHLR